MVDRLNLSRTVVKGHEYDVCPKGCRLYGAADLSSTYEFCQSDRFKSNVVVSVPVAIMKIVSIGDYLSSMLANAETRELLQYRANRVAIPGHFSDVFDGDNYKELVSQGHLFNADDIVIGLYIDAFLNQQSKRASYTIVHVIIFNLDPSIR